MENPLGIHCSVCTPENPCSPCTEQIAAEQVAMEERLLEEYADHLIVCDKPIPLCGPCSAAFNLRSYQ